MFNFILEIIFTGLLLLPFVFNVIAGSWLFVALDAIIVIFGIVNSILAYKNYKKKKNNGGNE
jgi:hypothetical protein